MANTKASGGELGSHVGPAHTAGRGRGCLRAVNCAYLLAFNLLSTYAWGRVFAIVVAHVLRNELSTSLTVSPWPDVGAALFVAQSLAVMEIVHSVFGASWADASESRNDCKENRLLLVLGRLFRSRSEQPGDDDNASIFPCTARVVPLARCAGCA